MSLRTVGEIIEDVEVFVGRSHEREVFLNLLASRRDIVPCICVLQLYGVGGIGKTSLLREYGRNCEARNYPHAIVNIRVQRGSIVDILNTFRQQFNTTIDNAREVFREYDKTLSRKDKIEGKLARLLRKEKGIMEGSTTEAIVELSAAATGTLVGSLLGPLGAVVGGGFGAAAGKAVMTGFGEKLVAELIRKGLPPDEARFLANADSILTRVFIEGVNKAAEQAGFVVLMVDTYEEVPAAIDEWIREELLKALRTNVLLIIAGRDKVTQQDDSWLRYSRLLQEVKVEKFKDEDAEAYLDAYRIASSELVEKIKTFTDRLPWALALLMDTWQSGGQLTVDDLDEGPVKFIVGHRVVRRFLNQIEGTDLENIMDICTVARRFNEEILEFLLNGEDIGSALKVLRKYSFVRVLNDGSYSLHDIVREFMLEDLKARSFAKYKQINRSLIEYYENNIPITGTIEVRKRYLTELLYHSLHYNEDMGIELFRETVSELDMYTQFDLRDALLNEIALFKFEKGENTHWQAYCKGYRAVNQGKWQVAEEHLTEVKQASNAPNLLRCLAYDTLGELYVGQGRYSFAIEILERSLELKQHLPVSMGLSSSGQTLSKLTECYAIIGEYRKAEEYAARILSSIQQNETSTAKAWAMKSLGDTYRLWGKTKLSIERFEEALAIFDDLGDEYARAHVQTQLGRVYLHDGQWKRAVESLNKASKTYENLWVEYGRANTLLFLGNIHLFKQEWQSAKDLYEQALAAHEAMDAKREIGPLLGSLGIVYQQLGDRERALNHFHRSVGMKTQQEYKRGVAVTEIYLGNFYLMENNLETAKEHFKTAQAMADTSRSNYHRIQSRSRIALCYLGLGDTATAEEKATKALNLAYRHGYKHEQARAHLTLFKIKSTSGTDIRARHHIKKALKAAVQYNCYLLSEIADDFLQFMMRKNNRGPRYLIQEIIAYWKDEDLQRLEEQNARSEEIENYQLLVQRLNDALVS